MSSLAVFPLIWQYDYEETMQHKTTVSNFESGTEQRRARWSAPLRQFRLNFAGLTYSSIVTLYDFYQARQGRYDAFYFDPIHYTPISNESIGVGDDIETNFVDTLTKFPVQLNSVTITDGSVTGTDNGSGAITGSGIGGTVDYDTGEVDVTFVTPPSTGSTIYATYDYYFRVRFAEDSLSLKQFAYRLYANQLQLQELRS